MQNRVHRELRVFLFPYLGHFLHSTISRSQVCVSQSALPSLARRDLLRRHEGLIRPGEVSPVKIDEEEGRKKTIYKQSLLILAQPSLPGLTIKQSFGKFLSLLNNETISGAGAGAGWQSYQLSGGGGSFSGDTLSSVGRWWSRYSLPSDHTRHGQNTLEVNKHTPYSPLVRATLRTENCN